MSESPPPAPAPGPPQPEPRFGYRRGIIIFVLVALIGVSLYIIDRLEKRRVVYRIIDTLSSDAHVITHFDPGEWRLFGRDSTCWIVTAPEGSSLMSLPSSFVRMDKYDRESFRTSFGVHFPELLPDPDGHYAVADDPAPNGNEIQLCLSSDRRTLWVDRLGW